MIATATGLSSSFRKLISFHSLLEVAAFIAVLGTAAALYFEDDLLTRELSFAAGDIAPEQEVFQFSDRSEGGTSSVQPIPGRKLSWSCTLTKAYENFFCGFGFALKADRTRGVDLSHYDSIRLALNHRGPGQVVRVYVKNYNPAYSRPGVDQMEKYNYADAMVHDGRQTIDLRLDRFAVADWWKLRFKIPPSLAAPEFKNVVAFEIQEGIDGKAGAYVTSIESVVFEERLLSSNQFYATLAIFWLLLLGGMLWRYRTEVAKRRELEAEQLKWASEHDPMTDLPNRRAFQSRLQAATQRAMMDGTSLALLLIDLDHFKHVNDSLGHLAGDELLRITAARLRNCVRGDDFVARIGGDEFAVILERTLDREHILARSKHILAQLLAPTRIGSRLLNAGASIGGAIFPGHSDNAVGLLKAADVALYALKTSGRGGTRMFDPGMLADDERARSQLETARAAVEAKTLVPHYQPKVDLVSGEIVGFEALLRSVHNSELHLPSSMQEAFGDYELASRIGELMQDQVAAQAAKWIDCRFEFGRISINASPAEFLRDDYAERLLNTLALHDVPASRIEVEVTEHVFMGQCGEYVVRALSSLRRSGIHVSLDDFGTGYSSLSHLRDLQVDTVKIDKSFVERITTDKAVAAIVTAVISLARSLGLSVVAEGIEKSSQVELLRALGCQYGQGFLFGDALSKEAAEELLMASQKAA